MEISVEIKDGLKRRMTIALPAVQVDEQVNKQFQTLRKQKVRIPGYKTGSLAGIKKHYGKSVEQEAIYTVINNTLPGAFEQESLEPAGSPMVESVHYKPKESTHFEFTILFEVYPQMSTPDFSKVELSKPVATLTAEDEQDELAELQEQACQWNPVERASKLGDRLTLDYVATVDGEALPHSRREATKLVLKEEDEILGFEKSLIGTKAGEEKDFQVPVTEEVTDEKLKGKTMEYHVVIKEVCEPQLPEFDDKFAEHFDIKEGGFEKLKEELKSSMQRQLTDALHNETKKRVLDKLLEIYNDLTIPEALIRDEIDNLRNQMIERFKQYVPNEQSLNLPDTMFEAEAKRRVSIGLLLHEYTKHHGLEPDQEQVDALINQQATRYPDPEQAKAYYYSNAEALNSIRSSVLEDKIINHLLDQANIIEETMSYKQLVKDRNSTAT